MNNDFDNNNQIDENNEQKPVEDTNQQQDQPINNTEPQSNFEEQSKNEPQPNPWANQQPQQPQTPPQNNYYEQKHYVPNAFQNNQGGFYKPPVNKTPNNGKKGFKINNTTDTTNSTQSSSDDSLKYKGEDIEVESGESVKRDDIKPDENGKYTTDQVAQLVGDSVVNIQVYSTTDSTTSATASGVILNKKGYIITNDHIYSSVTNAKFIITMNDGTSYKASYVAGDQRSDIAVLKFDEVPKNLVAATFANSSDVKAGDDVIAIGSPNGLSGTITKGIVSYPSRRITATSSSDSQSQTTANYSMRVIQTDAALNPGNSGGALVNMYGQVIGISSSKLSVSGYEGICFAIPSNDAVKYAKSLVKNGEVIGRAKLGITYQSISSAAALVNNLPAGLRISSIDSKSDLSTKGIATGENGDIITKINGKSITSSDIALDVIDDSSAGDEISLTIYSVSNKSTKTYKVTLMEDTSNTSYKNEIPKSTTVNPYGNGSDGNSGNYGNGNDNGNSNDGNGNGGSDGYQNPFSFGN